MSYKKNICDLPDKNYIAKKNVSKHEATMQRLVHSYVNVPEVYHYDEEKMIMIMRRIPKLCLADEYGENYDDLPNNIKTLLYEIMSSLFYNHFIYNDFTGYNFIYYQNKLWIIDFEHCKYDTDNQESFMKDFVEGTVTGWNPEFI